MSVEKEIAACRRKRQYPSKRLAELTASSTMKADLKGPNLYPYYCQWCGKWHLGRSGE